ncbi:hypothetical protein B5X24_HaOG206036 [Helicoverpa armigera]|uniref:Uncharacterized protein n=1 Tax=Helicoverpa armigera TaxID=29058 RepID=A0A2W1BPJ8_HELAM|nr:hypothetical protein B5X24_HaOG206036 [Helicoverpa armigera]
MQLSTSVLQGATAYLTSSTQLGTRATQYPLVRLVSNYEHNFIIYSMVNTISYINFRMARKAHYKYAPKIKPKTTETSFEAAILPIIVVKSKQNTVLTTYIGTLPATTSIKREIKRNYETEYDYDQLINEYYDEADSESLSGNAYHMRNSGFEVSEYGTFPALKRIFLISPTTNCSEERGIGIEALKCLYEDYMEQRQSMNEVLARFWSIFGVWIIVYLVIAIPLWCTRGWCCCCLRCKFFKPRQTIEEAKKYVVLYPPGIFKTKSGIIYYEPTERERECYEEFEHFIKTL